MTFIMYDVATEAAIRKCDEDRFDAGLRSFRLVRFESWETRDAAWIADATYVQAIKAFRGIEVGA